VDHQKAVVVKLDRHDLQRDPVRIVTQ